MGWHEVEGRIICPTTDSDDSVHVWVVRWNTGYTRCPSRPPGNDTHPTPNDFRVQLKLDAKCDVARLLNTDTARQHQEQNWNYTFHLLETERCRSECGAVATLFCDGVLDPSFVRVSEFHAVWKMWVTHCAVKGT